ncbi:hypothetical protein [Spirosoma validum]|uniref:Uncharacterized protein n=1 Tax=Spirosoma validum TaxID=2771355 RepID=A0A927AX93_9BACT|nr:hypothetical protein [Spirosoma validum]MBD2751460.1 hypothetical protein [Spirosoma validum]
MKTSCLLISLIGWLCCSCVAQSRSTKLAFYPRQYVVKVNLAAQSKAEKGILYDLTDSTIILAPMEWTKREMKALIKQHGEALPHTDSFGQVLPLQTYRYTDISRLTLHRRGSLVKGFLIGAGIGAIGSTVGLLVFPDGFDINFSGPRRQIPTTQKALGVIGTMAITGATGWLAGAATTKRIDARKHPVAIEVKKRFRDYTIVDQVNRATLYSRYR